MTMTPATSATNAKKVPIAFRALSCAFGTNISTTTPTIGKNVARLRPQPLSNHSILGQPPLEDHEQRDEKRHRSEQDGRVPLDIPTLDVAEETARNPRQ